MSEEGRLNVTVENVDGTTTTFETYVHSIKIVDGKIQVETDPGFYQFAEKVEPTEDGS